MLRKSKGSGFKMKGYQAHANSPLSSGSWFERAGRGLRQLGTDIKRSLHPSLGGVGRDPAEDRAYYRNQLRIQEMAEKEARDKALAEKNALYKQFHDEYDTIGIKDQRDGTTEWGGAETDDQYRRRMNDLKKHKNTYANKKVKEHYANLKALEEQKLNSQTPLTEEQMAMAEGQGSKRPPLMKKKKKYEY
jgi:hypothetical protein